MTIADQVYSELRFLPDHVANEVLDFVRLLAARQVNHDNRNEPPMPPPQEPSLEELLRPYRLPMEGFRFDRDEANARQLLSR
ncbi:MAG: hypothetical protein HQL96_14120 [Magnetococcales bacterium]|nr:hypothetical protein [Magnetococcales bacterium]